MPFSCRHSSYTRQNQAQTLTSTHDPRMHSLDSLGLEADNVCLDFGQHMADRKPIRCHALHAPGRIMNFEIRSNGHGDLEGGPLDVLNWVSSAVHEHR